MTALLAVGYAVPPALYYRNGQYGLAIAMGALCTFILWWSWPLRKGTHVDHADAQAGAGDDDVIVYWRPG